MAAAGSVHPSGLPAHPDPAVARLRAFRAELYACCTRRGDALVDLADALLSAQGPVASLPQLSLEPAHRRGWGSTYAALARGHIDAERLRDLLVCHPLAGGLPIYAVDVTTWPRCDAECSPERGLYYHPSRHSAGQPEDVPLGVELGRRSGADQAASSLAGVTAGTVWSSAARRAARCR